jgi:GABA permease
VKPAPRTFGHCPVHLRVLTVRCIPGAEIVRGLLIFTAVISVLNSVIASTIGGLVATLVNFIAPSSGIYDFIMNSTGLVALFVYVFIAVT